MLLINSESRTDSCQLVHTHRQWGSGACRGVQTQNQEGEEVGVTGRLAHADGQVQVLVEGLSWYQ